MTWLKKGIQQPNVSIDDTVTWCNSVFMDPTNLQDTLSNKICY
jgi:hypothetical protein